MRWQTKSFVERFLNETKQPFNKVLDVGSRSVDNQPTLKNIFGNTSYIGLDMIKGNNVDVVLNSHNLMSKFTAESFDLIMCFDMLEHDDKFWITVENIKWALQSKGWFLVGVPSLNMGEHDYPHDYWRFMPQGVEKLLEGFENVYIEPQTDGEGYKFFDEIYGWGQKP